MGAPKVSSRARSHLRSLAHHLEPVVQVGGEGVSQAVVDATHEALQRHELIKVKIGQAFEGDRREAAKSLAQATDADLTQVIGRVVILYRPRGRDLPGRPRIVLP